MTLTDVERQWYGDGLQSALADRGVFVRIVPSACWNDIAAAVIAARDADLAATVRQWRDEALATRESAGVEDYLMADWREADVQVMAYDKVLVLLERGDDASPNWRQARGILTLPDGETPESVTRKGRGDDGNG